jgi:integrase
MAYVVKDSRGRSPYWIACYADSTGRWLKKSTKLTNKKRALEVALSLEHGEKLARRGAFNETRLRELLEQTLERVIGAPVEHYTAETWFKWWIEKGRGRWSASTAERYQQVARDFIQSLSQRAKLPLEHVSDKDVLAYRNGQTKRGMSNRSANLAVKIVSMAFNDALRQQKIKFNPCLGLGALDEEEAEREPFTAAEVKQILEVATGDWRRAILLAYFSGARLSDIANLSYSALDWERELLIFTPEKTRRRKKKPIAIPLHPDLKKELLKNPGVGAAPMFPSLAGRKTGGTRGLSAQFKAIMLKAHVRGDVVRHTAAGRRNETKGFHSFRHLFTSALANRGVPREVRQLLTGHSAGTETDTVYVHHQVEQLRAAVLKLQTP